MNSCLIAGERIFLRKLAETDCTDTYIGWLNDPMVNRFLETRHVPQDRKSTVDYVTSINAKTDEFLFGIFLTATSEHIGNIKVGPIFRRHPVADISLLIGAREHWRQGYATEGISILSRYAFDRLNVRKLSASMYADNRGSYRCFLKAGYQAEGLRRAHYLFDGRMTDLIEFGLTPADLADVN
jgi:RimJ/RimL family protein N-acetyltransferase